MPTRWIEQARYWSGRRFAAVTILFALVCVVLLVLDGISAAVHFHAGVAVFGIAFFVVLILWFRIMEARSQPRRRE